MYLRADINDLAWLQPHQITCPIRRLSTDVFASLTDQPHPQGAIGVYAMDETPVDTQYDVWDNDLVLVVDAIADPGNLGTLIRSAAAAGATRVLISPNSVDPFHPRCVRAAMGAHFLVSIRQATLSDIGSLVAGLPIVALADANGEIDDDAVDWTGPCAIVIGNEATGPTPRIRQFATMRVRIPLARNLESLNAGVAGSLLLLGAARQRRGAQRLCSAELKANLSADAASEAVIQPGRCAGKDDGTSTGTVRIGENDHA